jgi:GT2 family glycosyltransferase
LNTSGHLQGCMNNIEDGLLQLDISILIVYWNSAAYLPRCLASLSSQTHVNFEIIVVDNGSEDGALDGLHEKYPSLNLHIHRLTSNLGFAVANNVGARFARGKWLALLNADAFPEPDWLEQMLKAADQNPQFTFFTSLQIQANIPELLDGTGDAYHVSGLAWRQNYNHPVSKYSIRSCEVFSACGAAALYPRQEFLDAGGFDEDYFSYHEDIDLGFRLRLRGLNCVLVPQAIVHHIGSASTGKRSDFSVYYGHRNLVWTYFKDMPAVLFWCYLPLHIAVNIFFLIYFTLKGKGNVIWRAKLDAIRGLPMILRKRREVQLQRQIPFAEIHRVMSRNWLTPFLSFINRKSG